MYSLGHSLLPAEQIFHVAELSAAVDPSKAKVTFKDGMLEIVMPKASATIHGRAQTNLNSPVDDYTLGASATASADAAVKETGDKGKAVSSIG
jgi:copper(I)-binding protein